MNEEDLLPETPECSFCFGKNRENIFVIQKNPEVHLALCNDCFAVSATRIPNETALKNFYKTYYDQYSKKISFSNPLRLAKHIYKHSCITFETSLTGPRTIKILDFGSGNGEISIELSKILVKKNFDAALFLVDYNIDLPAIDNPKISINVFRQLSEFTGGDLDIIIASTIIEHLPFPAREINDLFSRLKPGGIFYTRTPCIIPLMMKLDIFNIRLDFLYPAHLHDLGPRFWEKFLIEKNFKIIRSAPSLVETSFKKDFLKFIAASIIRAPWYIFRTRYHLSGSWEVFCKK